MNTAAYDTALPCALEMIGPDAKEAAPALAKLLKDTDSETRFRAILALGAIQGKDAAASIAGVLEDPEAGVASQAFYCLEQLGAPAEALPGLVAVIQNPRVPRGRSAKALKLLARIDASKVTAPVDTLIKALEIKDARVRKLVAIALGNKGDSAKNAIPALKSLLDDSDDSLRKEAAAAIKKIESE